MDIEKKLQVIEDRRLISELVVEYAYCADERRTEDQMNLFAEDGCMVTYMDSETDKPSWAIERHQNMCPAFEALNNYERTMHFVGQNTVTMINDHEAIGILS